MCPHLHVADGGGGVGQRQRQRAVRVQTQRHRRRKAVLVDTNRHLPSHSIAWHHGRRAPTGLSRSEICHATPCHLRLAHSRRRPARCHEACTRMAAGARPHARRQHEERRAIIVVVGIVGGGEGGGGRQVERQAVACAAAQQDGRDVTELDLA